MLKAWPMWDGAGHTDAGYIVPTYRQSQMYPWLAPLKKERVKYEPLGDTINKVYTVLGFH